MIRDALRLRGYDAWSCDLRECTADPAYHFLGNVFEIIDLGWRMGIFHPDCTYLTSSGLHWNARVHGRHACTLYGLNTVRRIMASPIPMWAIENPKGAIGTNIRPTGRLPGRVVTPDPADLFGRGTERWSNQADDGQNKLGETKDRWIKRSATYPGIANAMAEQWGAWLERLYGSEAVMPARSDLVNACNSHRESGDGSLTPPPPPVPGADAGTAGKLGPFNFSSTIGS